MHNNSTLADSSSAENSSAPKIFVDDSWMLEESRSPKKSFQKPILWVSDTATAAKLQMLFDVVVFGDETKITPGDHYLIVEKHTPASDVKATAWKLLAAGINCKIYQVQTSLEYLLNDEATSVKETILHILEFALPFEEWTARIDDLALTTREAVEIAKVAIALLKEPQKSVEIATLRKRCGESSFDWNTLMRSLEEQFRLELRKRKGQEVDEEGISDVPSSSTGKKKIPPADLVAQRIAEDYRDTLAFNNEIGMWIRYEAVSPGVWSVETDEFIESIVYHILTARGIQGYNSHSYITNIVKSLRNQLIRRNWSEPSPHKLLPHRNGVLDVATGELLPHSPHYGFTWSLPRDYNPLATDWSSINNFLDHLSGNNPAIKDLLICYCNAVLKGRHDLQKFLHLIGLGGTGKGTFARLLTSLIGGENVYTTTLDDWCTNRFEGANAYGKRLVLFPDEDKQTGKLGKFLSLTGEDLIRAEEKNKKAFQYRYDGMVLVMSNLPIFTGDSASRVKRRIITVPCNNQVSLFNRSRNLEAEFAPELTAFTNYVLSISDDHVTNVLLGVVEIPECSLEFWENRMRTDSIAAWLNDWVIFDPMAETQVGSNKDEELNGEPISLYGSYAKHCRRSGSQVKAVKNFSPDLLELCRSVLGWEVERHVTKTGKFIRGLRLRKDLDLEIPTYDYSLMQRVMDGVTFDFTSGDESKPLQSNDFLKGDDIYSSVSENQLTQNLDTSLSLSDHHSLNGDEKSDKCVEVEVHQSSLPLESLSDGHPEPSPQTSLPPSPQPSPESEWMSEESLNAIAYDLEACDDIEVIQILRSLYNKEALKAAARRIPQQKREQIREWIAQLDAEAIDSV